MNDHPASPARPAFSSHAMSLRGLRLGLAYDVPAPLDATSGFPFPDDATAEWETRETTQKMAAAWSSLGCEVVMLPVDFSFWANWQKHFSRLDLVHSLVEGWGCVSREGWIPGICEMSGIPCIGSSPLAQGIAMRKSLLKILCAEARVPTADFFLVRTLSDCDVIPERLTDRPHFLKPDCEGSGMGVDKATSAPTGAKDARERARSLLRLYPDGVIVESLLPGEELTTALVGSPLRQLPVARIEVEGGVYGIANKSKAFMGEKVTFPELPPGESDLLEGFGQRLAHLVGFEDFVRFDWKRDEQGVVTFMEANPLAGLSYYYSVLPKIAEQAGMTYVELLATLAHSALSKREDRRYWYGLSRLRP